MNASNPSVRLAAALLLLAAALPAAAQYEPPPDAWPPPSAPPQPAERPRRPPPPPAWTGRDDGGYPPDAYPPPRRGYGPPPAYAPAPRAAQPRVELALRASLASPGGDAEPGVPFADLFGNQLALGVDLGLRATPNVYLGVFAEAGFGGASNQAGFGGATCSAMTGHCGGAVSGRLGLGFRYHFAPYAPLDPWVGYGVAISGASVSGDTASGSFSTSYTGFEFAKLSAGVDLQLGGTTAVGLFAEWSSGVFTDVEDRQNGVVVASGSLPATSTHSWFTIGPRIRF
jgi:opacity protein-like surface antigen